MKKKRNFGGINAEWLEVIGGRPTDRGFQFFSTKDEFGKFEFYVQPNGTGSCVVRGKHYLATGGNSDLKDQSFGTREKLLQFFQLMRVKCKVARTK